MRSRQTAHTKLFHKVVGTLGFICSLYPHYINMSTQIQETKHVLFPKRPLLCGKPMTDEEVRSCLEEAGQTGFTFSFMLSA